MLQEINIKGISPYAIPGLTKRGIPDSEVILNYVCEYFNQSKADIKGKFRKREFVTPRHIAMYLIRKQTSESVLSIGKRFNRDHTTVLNATNKVNGFLDIKDFETIKAIEAITNKLNK